MWHLLVVLVAAALIVGCGAPEPTPTGHEYDEFMDRPLEPNATAPSSKRVPSGCALIDCGEETFGAVSMVVTFDDDDQIIIEWEGANALGVLVTDREAVLPAGPNDCVQGTAFWVLSTLAFPEGFAGPVLYGTIPSGGEDVTDEHGGSIGGSALTAGVCYKFSVTNNEFKTGSLVRGWE